MRALTVFLATGAYTGFGPIVPGTWGTLPAIALFYFMADWPVWLYALTVVALIGVGSYVSGRAVEIFHSPDSGMIVIDEIAGYLVTVALLPWSATTALIAFVWFRIFDIAKPWPIRWIDRNVKGGFGVMADDLLAGVFAMVATRATLYFV